jgi:hypothetical protein
MSWDGEDYGNSENVYLEGRDSFEMDLGEKGNENGRWIERARSCSVTG